MGKRRPTKKKYEKKEVIEKCSNFQLHSYFFHTHKLRSSLTIQQIHKLK